MTKANEITFGIEVETHVANTEQVGGYHHPQQASYLPQGWGTSYDSSIDYPRGRQGCEYVSPKLKGVEGLLEAQTAINAIAQRGAKVNSSCGVHVTVTFPAHNAAALSRLLCLFANYELGFFAATGTRRRQHGSWCKPIKQHGNGQQGSKAKAERAASRCKRDRYHAINLTHMAAGSNRLEFRLFSGSTNAKKILAWVRLVLAVCEWALDDSSKAPSFDSNRSFKHSSWNGQGEAELYQLLNKLGWYKVKRFGFSGRTYGESTFVEGLPTLDETRKELKRLARKHDAE